MLNQLLRGSALVAASVLAMGVAGCSKSSGKRGAGASVAPSTSGTTPVTSSSTNGSFANVPPLAEGRVHHTATLLASGKILIIGGQTSATAVAATTEIYDPATGQLAKGPALGTARMNHRAILLPTQKVLVVGGQSDVQGRNALDTTEVYNPQTNVFAPGPKLSEARSCPTLAMYKDGVTTKVLIAGGASFKSSLPTSLKTADIYNADANTLAASTAQLIQDRFAAEAISQANGQILIQGGYTGLGSAPKAADSEVYDIKNGVFVAVKMSAARAESALAQIGNDSYAVGGTDGSAPLASSEMFNGQLWAAGPALTSARQGHTASLVEITPQMPSSGTGPQPAIARAPTKMLLVAGGLAGAAAISDAELLVPGSQSGSLAGPALNIPRAYHTATALSNNQVVIVGGSDAAGNILSAIEVYAPNGSTVPGATTTNSGTATPGATAILPPPPPPSTVNIASLNPASGAVGATVTITGTGFSANPADNVVKFNGTLAQVTKVDVANPQAMTIETKVPTGATTGPVTIEIAGQVSPQNPVFTVTTPTGPAPRILFVLPNSSKTFLPVSITGQDFGSKPIATFNGVPTINLISLSTKSLPFIGSVSELIVIVPPGATSGPLLVSNNGLSSNPFFFTVK